MIQATPPQMADADILKVSSPHAWPGDCLGSWGSRSRGIMTWEPGSEAVGGHEETRLLSQQGEAHRGGDLRNKRWLPRL